MQVTVFELSGVKEAGQRRSSGHSGLVALHLLGDIASHLDRFDAESGEAYYGQALALAEPSGVRPLIAHCHLGLGKLHWRAGKREQGDEHLTNATILYREKAMSFGWGWRKTYRAPHASKDQDIMMREGDLITVRTPGGGGYGNPFEREPELVARDVQRGYFDTEDAARDCGVALNEDLSVDLGATNSGAA